MVGFEMSIKQVLIFADILSIAIISRQWNGILCKMKRENKKVAAEAEAEANKERNKRPSQSCCLRVNESSVVK